MTPHQIVLTIAAACIVGMGLLLRAKGALSTRGLMAAVAATAAVFAVMFFSQ